MRAQSGSSAVNLRVVPGSRGTQPEAEAYCPSCDRSFSGTVRACPDDGATVIRIGRDPMIGREIDGRYAIRDKIAVGGMGIVYRAWQASLRREVAIKVMRTDCGIETITAK